MDEWIFYSCIFRAVSLIFSYHFASPANRNVTGDSEISSNFSNNKKRKPSSMTLGYVDVAVPLLENVGRIQTNARYADAL